MSELLTVGILDRFVQMRQEFHTLGGDSGHDHAAVLGFAAARDQFPFLQPIKKPGNVRIPSDHAVGNLSTRQSLRRPPKDSENVVLGRGQVGGFKDLSGTARKQITGPQEVQKSGLLWRAPWPDRLLHGLIIRVTTTIVKTESTGLRRVHGRTGPRWPSLQNFLAEPSHMQRTEQGTYPVPDDLNPNTYKQKGGKPHDDRHGCFPQDSSQLIGEPVAE